MVFSFLKDYVRHSLTAKTRHGLHSPFVYRLLDEVIYDKRPQEIYSQIENRKRGLLPNSRRRGNRPKADQLLYRLARHFSPQHMVEIGTGMGISKLYLSRALPHAQLTCLEHNGALKHATAKLTSIDLAFINYYDPAELLNCFELLLPKIKPDSVLVICNIYGHPLAKQNFQAIKAHPRVTATVDLFWLQLVFFRDGMAKEHFRLKF